MADFTYKAADAKGAIKSGSMEAQDRREVSGKLAVMGLVPILIKRAQSGDSQPDEGDSRKLRGGGERLALALIKKLHQLCVGGGMPVADALKALSQRSLDPRLKKISRELYKDLSEGQTLSASLEKYPQAFDACTVHLVEAGEATANLGFVFENIIEYIEERRKLRKTIMSALAYPIFLCVMAAGVVLMFLFFMLPKIQSMMSSMGAGENFPIKMMNAIGDILIYGVPDAVVLGVAAFVGLKFYRKTPGGTKNADAVVLKIPALGKMVFDADLCRFANLAATLFESGVNTTETFRLSEKSLKNADMRDRFQQFRTAVNDGAPISAALQRFGLLENEDLDVVSVGERTGSLVSAFREINRSHAESLNGRIKISTVILGGVALGLAFLLVLIFAMGIVLSVLGLSQSMLPA